MGLDPFFAHTCNLVCSWTKFLKLADVEVITTKKNKRLVNGSNHVDSSPGTPVTSDDVAKVEEPKAFISDKDLVSLAGEEINGRVIKMLSMLSL